jgi:hypothetical protein
MYIDISHFILHFDEIDCPLEHGYWLKFLHFSAKVIEPDLYDIAEVACVHF